jgi:hypothetical protein
MKSKLSERVEILEKELSKLKRSSKAQPLRVPYKVKQFKSYFKVGDLITGWSTGLTLEITAIGNKRFIGLDQYDRERVCTIESHDWAKVEKERNAKQNT